MFVLAMLAGMSSGKGDGVPGCHAPCRAVRRRRSCGGISCTVCHVYVVDGQSGEPMPTQFGVGWFQFPLLENFQKTLERKKASRMLITRNFQRLQLWHFGRSWREGSAVVEKQHFTVVWVVYLVDKNWFGKRVHLVWLSLLNQAAAIYFVITLHPYPLYMVKRNCPAYINVEQFFT